jgi:hypothetical protein
MVYTDCAMPTPFELCLHYNDVKVSKPSRTFLSHLLVVYFSARKALLFSFDVAKCYDPVAAEDAVR